MGWMRGREDKENEAERVKTPVSIEPVNFTKGMIELSFIRNNQILKSNSHEIEPNERKSIQVWTGWLIYDVRICHFEIDQFVRAHGYRVNRKISWHKRKDFESVVEQAEQTLYRFVSNDWSKSEPADT